MAGAGWGGERPSAASLLLLSAVFIILSVWEADGRQCYWCGPLAEQVHRSRRAPPCEVKARHVTVCEPGYDHCAIVATSPPYVESRFCVKFYQDECYPLFCNSTKTWKMTCPCRGDLCNGANSEREEDAFSALSRLLAKTHSRIQKRAPSVQFSGNRKEGIVNPELDDDHLAGNSVEENKSKHDNQMQNSALSIDNQPPNYDRTSETVTGNTPASHATSTSVQPVESEKEQTDNDASISERVHTENDIDIQTTEGQKSEHENGYNIEDATIGAGIDNVKQSSTNMIEIDIVQRPSTFAQFETTVSEISLQADEPMHQDDQSEIGNKYDDVHSEETKTGKSTSSPKLPVSTGHSSQAEASSNSAEKIETNFKVKPSESTSAVSVQKIESPTANTFENKPVSEKLNEINSTERINTIAPTVYQVTHNTLSSVTQSSKDKKNKNHATVITINIFSIINCISLSTFIQKSF